MPKIGSSTNKKTRYTLPGGLKKFTIRSEQDLELLLMNNRSYCAEISQRICAKKRYIFLLTPYLELEWLKEQEN